MSDDRIDGDRTIRIEFLDGGTIEVLRIPESGKAREPSHHSDLEAALVAIELLIRAAHAKMLKNKFVSKLDKECNLELRKKLQGGSLPYGIRIPGKS